MCVLDCVKFGIVTSVSDVTCGWTEVVCLFDGLFAWSSVALKG